MSKVETLAGAKELEILQKQLDQPSSKPNFGGAADEEGIENMIMGNTEIGGMFKSAEEQKQFTEFFKKMNNQNHKATNGKIQPMSGAGRVEDDISMESLHDDVGMGNANSSP